MNQQLAIRVSAVLQNRKQRGLLRELRSPQDSTCDFSSNDYLGLSRDPSYHSFIANYLQTHSPTKQTGSTGSRLLSGHSREIGALETVAANFHNAECGLLFNSGYDANLSLLSCLPGPNDAIIYDEFVHASIYDGMRMSRAKSHLYNFCHNDMASLEATITYAARKVPASVIVCVETVYSMDGDVTPIADVLNICSKLRHKLNKEIHVIADEAHAGGIYGKYGEGLVASTTSHTHPCLLANVITYGKAFAAHGAIVLTRQEVRDYLINYARPFIYSTALPPHSVSVLRAAYAFAKTSTAKEIRSRLWSLVEYVHREFQTHLPPQALLPHIPMSPIQGIRVPGNSVCVKVANHIRSCGFDVYPIRSPTVPKGTERIRIILHAHNTTTEVDLLLTVILQGLKGLFPRPRL